MAELSWEVSAHNTLIGKDVSSGVEGLKEFQNDVEKLLKVAAVTRCEALLCQVLRKKPNAKTPSRIRSYTAECATAVKGSWQEWVHAGIVDLCEQILSSTFT